MNFSNSTKTLNSSFNMVAARSDKVSMQPVQHTFWGSIPLPKSRTDWPSYKKYFLANANAELYGPCLLGTYTNLKAPATDHTAKVELLIEYRTYVAMKKANYAKAWLSMLDICRGHYEFLLTDYESSCDSKSAWEAICEWMEKPSHNDGKADLFGKMMDLKMILSDDATASFLQYKAQLEQYARISKENGDEIQKPMLLSMMKRAFPQKWDDVQTMAVMSKGGNDYDEFVKSAKDALGSKQALAERFSTAGSAKQMHEANELNSPPMLAAVDEKNKNWKDKRKANKANKKAIATAAAAKMDSYKPSKFSFKGKCNYCKIVGHKAIDCYKKKREEKETAVVATLSTTTMTPESGLSSAFSMPASNFVFRSYPIFSLVIELKNQTNICLLSVEGNFSRNG